MNAFSDIMALKKGMIRVCTKINVKKGKKVF